MDIFERMKESNLEFPDNFDSTFPTLYRQWTEQLFERVMRLFEWTIDDNEIDQKEIEERLLLNGSCGISTYKGKLTAFYGSFSTPTIYYDEYKYYNVYSPIYSACKTIDKDVIVIDNNAVRTNVRLLIHTYATMLAHCDLTIINLLINARNDGTTPVVNNQQQLNQYNQYRNALINGKLKPIMDSQFLGIEFVESKSSQNMNIKDCYETRENILNAFYNEFGIKTNNEKKGNMIVDEVAANDSKFLINIDDMLAARQRGCEKVNKKNNRHWSVKLARGLVLDSDNKGDDDNGKMDN